MASDNNRTNLFKGVSLLRAEEKKKEGHAGPKGNSALQEYLKKYTDGPSDDAQKKKRKKVKTKPVGNAVKIIDEDVGLAPPRKDRYDDEEEEEECECHACMATRMHICMVDKSIPARLKDECIMVPSIYAGFMSIMHVYRMVACMSHAAARLSGCWYFGIP